MSFFGDPKKALELTPPPPAYRPDIATPQAWVDQLRTLDLGGGNADH